MKKVKLSKIVLLVVSVFVFIGIYKGIENIFLIKKIEREGEETVATIIDNWRGKCGSGYGNYASYSFTVKNINYIDTSSCTAPLNIKKGERYVLKYYKNNPKKNKIIFSMKIIN